MCLAVPGKVVEVFEEAGLKMGKIDYAGTVNKVCLELIPDIRVGDYTVVHAGFGISVINEEEAIKSYEAWEEMIEAASQHSDTTHDEFLDNIRSLKNDALLNN